MRGDEWGMWWKRGGHGRESERKRESDEAARECKRDGTGGVVGEKERE